MRNDGLFERMGYRQTVEAKLLSADEKRRDIVYAKTEGGHIDQSVDVSKAAQLSLLHMNFRRARELQLGADKPN